MRLGHKGQVGWTYVMTELCQKCRELTAVMGLVVEHVRSQNPSRKLDGSVFLSNPQCLRRFHRPFHSSIGCTERGAAPVQDS